MNFNGWRHLGTYVLGYRDAPKLNFAGVMVETEAWLGDLLDVSTMATAGWGSDFVTVTISPLANLAFDETQQPDLRRADQEHPGLVRRHDTVQLPRWSRLRGPPVEAGPDRVQLHPET
ncbi:MAG: hypothetical protein MZU95_09260 [Desulfomicrobium escambiense]|nr:hypothetical protein [Desulfomicrobium escambiense]